MRRITLSQGKRLLRVPAQVPCANTAGIGMPVAGFKEATRVFTQGIQTAGTLLKA